MIRTVPDLQRLTAAERLLWGYGITEPSHIDLEAIAFDHGARVVFRPLGGCEARLLACGDRAIISVSPDSSNGRQRFSLAHEMAHWICDRKTGSFLCAKEDIGPQSDAARSVEASANSYASQLILPAYLVNSWANGRGISLDIASELGNAFNSSLTAAAIRLLQLTTRSACLVCHEVSRRRWVGRSPSFPTDFMVTGELHHDTEAFRLVLTSGTGRSIPKREPANRWLYRRSGDRREIDQMGVVTQSIRLPDATVLTLILLEP